MKVKVTLKDPDALADCIDSALCEMEYGKLSDDEIEAVKELRKEEILDKCKKWFEYGEYLTVEIDTEKDTATVIELA